jgi:hypothetical protein
MRLKFKAKRPIGREIAHRIDLNGTAEGIVQRDLERYYDLVARERRKIALTRDEASWYASPSEVQTCNWMPCVRCGRGLGISRT